MPRRFARPTGAKEMLTLFDYLPSQNAWKVRLLLAQLKRPYEQKLIGIFDGEGQTDEFLRISPLGTVPAIQLADGRPLAESNAILAFLADGSTFLPADPHARALVAQWLAFDLCSTEYRVRAFRHAHAKTSVSDEGTRLAHFDGVPRTGCDEHAAATNQLHRRRPVFDRGYLPLCLHTSCRRCGSAARVFHACARLARTSSRAAGIWAARSSLQHRSVVNEGPALVSSMARS